MTIHITVIKNTHPSKTQEEDFCLKNIIDSSSTATRCFQEGCINNVASIKLICPLNAAKNQGDLQDYLARGTSPLVPPLEPDAPRETPARGLQEPLPTPHLPYLFTWASDETLNCQIPAIECASTCTICAVAPARSCHISAKVICVPCSCKAWGILCDADKYHIRIKRENRRSVFPLYTSNALKLDLHRF